MLTWNTYQPKCSFFDDILANGSSAQKTLVQKLLTNVEAQVEAENIAEELDRCARFLLLTMWAEEAYRKVFPSLPSSPIEAAPTPLLVAAESDDLLDWE